MTPKPNPFPNYPVAGLGGDEEELKLTVRTSAIVQAEELIDGHLTRFAEASERRGLNAAVKGEYGAGKTHLLRHARGYARERSRGRDLSPAILSVGAMESSPAHWYRAAIGPMLADLDLEGLMFELYVEAAKSVAAGASLTAGAVPHIEADPSEVLTLVQEDLLSGTSVERELFDVLDRILPGIAPDVRGALEKMLAEPRPCQRWLEGERLSDREVLATGLPPALDSDNYAADAVVAIAAVHAFLDQPFLFLVDELEHFIRYDESSDRKTNVTWLKRLLERLAGCDAAVFVAGHSSAWRGHPDFLDRFSSGATMELVPLNAEQLLEMVDRYAGERGLFGPQTAELVASMAGEGVRHALTTLSRLYDESEGFDKPLDAEEVAEVAAATARREDPERIVRRLASMFVSMGLRAALNTEIGGMTFDLVAYRGAEPAAVVEVRHAHFGKQQQEQAQRFVDKLRIVNRSAPTCVGVFASAGSLDRALAEIDTAAAHVFWLDLTEPDFVTELRSTLEPVLAEAPAGSGAESSDKREKALEGVSERIEEAKQTQAPEYEQLEARLSETSQPVSDLRFRAPSSEETRDTRRTLFDTFTKRPSLIKRLALIRGPVLPAAATMLVIGIAAIAQASAIAEAIAGSQDTYNLIQILCFLGGVLMVGAAMYLVLRQFLVVDRFYDLKEERLRESYVLERELESLVELNHRIDRALASFGPRHAMMELDEMYREAPGEIGKGSA